MKLLLPLLFATQASAFAPTSHSIRQHNALFADTAEETATETIPAPEAQEAAAPVAAVPVAAGSAAAVSAATIPSESAGLSYLKSLAFEANPIVQFYDPLNLVELDILYEGEDATIGFLRHAEIKHGRVAMAAFVGYCIQSNWHWPWDQSLDGSAFPSIDLSPEQQWDAIPAIARWQIILFVGALELWSEATGKVTEEPHYMKGGQPGKFPSLQLLNLPSLYDPFGVNKKMTDEMKERRLVMEVNNGRLAMLGIFGFLCADTIEGSVPLLTNIAIPYSGQVMSPFEAGY